MKKIISILILLALAYLGASWWLGQQVESRHQDWLDQGMTLLGDSAQVHTEYQRQLFGARSTTTVRLRPDVRAENDQPGLENLRLKIHETIRHGPLVGMQPAAAHIRTHFELEDPDGLLDEWRQIAQQAPAPEIETTVSLDGSVEGVLNLPAGTLSAADAGNFRARWDALQYWFQASADGQKISGTLRWPRAEMQLREPGDPANDTVRVDMNGMNGSFDAELDGQWLMMPGQTHVEIDHFSVHQGATDTSDAPPRLRLDQLRATGSNQRQKGTMNGQLNAEAAMQIGDQLRFPSARWSARLNRVGDAFLTLAREELLRMLAEGEDAAPPADDRLEALVQSLLEHSPEYQEETLLTLEDQDQASFGWSVAVGDLPRQMADLVPRLPWQLTALQRLTAHASFSLPKTLLPGMAQLVDDPNLDAETLEQMAQMYVHAGVLREEDGHYAMDASYRKGKFKLNGETMSLERLLQGVP